MKFTQIRNATVLIEYAGLSFLIDPMFGAKGSHGAIPQMANSQCHNPLVDLPFSAAEILQKADIILLTHTHPDHWDEAAIEMIPKDFPIFVQNEADLNLLTSQGFLNLKMLERENHFDSIKIIKTGGQHGTEEIYGDPDLADFLGDACGFIFTSEKEPSLYLMGDTIWTKEIADNLRRFQPDIAILNAGYGLTLENGSMIMGTEDFLRVNKFLPRTKMIATHLEAVAPCILSRADLRHFVRQHGISEKTFVPEDGETLLFPL